MVPSVAASEGSAAVDEVQVPLVSVSITACLNPPASMYCPTATQKVADGHDTARHGWAKPQLCEPNQKPWFEPVPESEGCGASVSVQVVPFWVSMRPQVWADASEYQPTETHTLAAAQVDEAT